MKHLLIAFYLTHICLVQGLFNHTDLFTSAYAKVAKWGSSLTENANSNPNGQGRSSGQQFYTQSSTVDVQRGQNIKKQQLRPVYFHKNSKVDVISSDPLPGKGEVVQQAQDRFQPPPYYAVVDDLKSFGPEKTAKQVNYVGPMYVTPNPPAPRPSVSIVKSVQPSVDSFPNFLPPDNIKPKPNNNPPPPQPPPDSVISFTPPPPPSPPKKLNPPKPKRPMPKPPMGPSYDSPYSSYNPPMEKPPMEHNRPPSGLYDSPYSSYNPPRKPPKNEGVAYPPLADSPYPPRGSYLPPQDYVPSKKMPSKQMEVKKPPPMPMESMEDTPSPMEDNGNEHKHYNHEQIYDQLPEGVLHDAKDAPDDVVNGDDMGNGNDDMGGGGDDMGGGGDDMNGGDNVGDDGGGNGDGNDDSNDKGKAPSDDDDMQPPPRYPNLPKYVEKDPHQYDFGHYYNPYHHHHVYHEIKHKPTTTTTEAPKEETRVSSSHYSYYYLGRKLWYIPLYFSVYFICYITALILKSIARHKVSLVHTYGAKEARSFSNDKSKAETQQMLEDSETRYAM